MEPFGSQEGCVYRAIHRQRTENVGCGQNIIVAQKIDARTDVSLAGKLTVKFPTTRTPSHLMYVVCISTVEVWSLAFFCLLFFCFFSHLLLFFFPSLRELSCQMECLRMFRKCSIFQRFHVQQRFQYKSLYTFLRRLVFESTVCLQINKQYF